MTPSRVIHSSAISLRISAPSGRWIVPIGFRQGAYAPDLDYLNRPNLHGMQAVGARLSGAGVDVSRRHRGRSEVSGQTDG
jgi:hypothetical protein